MRYDCHVQVFDPGRWQPVAPSTLPPSTAAQLQASLRRRGIRAAVLVQPRAYREAHGCFLDALRQIGGAGCGVASASRHTCGSEVAAWARSGVRAVRLAAQGDAWAMHDQVQELGQRIPPEWPIELEGTPVQLEALAPRLAHSGRTFVCTGAAFGERLLWWAEMGNLYLKLVAPADGPPLQALARRLPDRLLWGSGWPRVSAPAPASLRRLAPALDANAETVYGLAITAGYGRHDQVPLATAAATA